LFFLLTHLIILLQEDMMLSPHRSPTRSAEQFYPNQARVTGVIQRLWLEGEAVLCRLQPDGQAGLITLNFPQGRPLDGTPLSLAPGLRLLAQGYLCDFEYRETLAEVLRDWPHLIQPGDETIIAKHTVINLLVEQATFLDPAAQAVNEARLGGVVARTWRMARHPDLFATLAVYDAHSPALSTDTPPRRQAHYTRLIFPNSVTADGVPVDLKNKQTALVEGTLRGDAYSERVADFLRRAKRDERLDDKLAARRLGRSVLRVVGQRVIILKA
jgi:hypothetical protein